MKLNKNKKKTKCSVDMGVQLRGGEFIGAGTYGCSFSPPLSDKIVGEGQNLGKVAHKGDVEQEVRLSQRFFAVDTQMKYGLYGTPVELDTSAENVEKLIERAGGENEIQKCRSLFVGPALHNILNASKQKDRSQTTEKEDLAEIVMPRGNMNLQTLCERFSQITGSSTPPREIRNFLKGLLAGLIHLATGLELYHTNNLVHCDIKLENIVVHNNLFKYIDWGISGTREQPSESIDEPTPYFVRNYAAVMVQLRALIRNDVIVDSASSGIANTFGNLVKAECSRNRFFVVPSYAKDVNALVHSYKVASKILFTRWQKTPNSNTDRIFDLAVCHDVYSLACMVAAPLFSALTAMTFTREEAQLVRSDGSPRGNACANLREVQLAGIGLANIIKSAFLCSLSAHAMRISLESILHDISAAPESSESSVKNASDGAPSAVVPAAPRAPMSSSSRSPRARSNALTGGKILQSKSSPARRSLRSVRSERSRQARRSRSRSSRPSSQSQTSPSSRSLQSRRSLLSRQSSLRSPRGSKKSPIRSGLRKHVDT